MRAASPADDGIDCYNRLEGYSGAVMCIRCHNATAPEPLGFCAPCAMHVRIEVGDGFRRFAGYLEAWAAWHAWLRRRGLDADELA